MVVFFYLSCVGISMFSDGCDNRREYSYNNSFYSVLVTVILSKVY